MLLIIELVTTQIISVDFSKFLKDSNFLINSLESITLNMHWYVFFSIVTSIDFFRISFKSKSISSIFSPGNKSNNVDFPTPSSPVKRIWTRID